MATHKTRHGVLAEQIKKCEMEQRELNKTVIDIHGSLTRSEGRMNNFESALMEMGKQMAEMNERQELLIAMFAKIAGGNSTAVGNQNGKDIVIGSSDSSTLKNDGILTRPAGNLQTHTNRPIEMNGIRLPKLDFPYFTGESPREWIRKAQKYFNIHQIEDHLRVPIAEMYLQGKADIWYHSFAASHPNASWEIFTEAMCRRFTKTVGGEVVERFSKIKQKGDVGQYQELFEELKAQMMWIIPQAPESYYILVFTSGLIDEIKSTVKIMRPQTLAHAFEISSLQESSIRARNRNTKITKPYQTTQSPFISPKTNYTYTTPTQNFHKPHIKDPRTPQTPITKYKTLTPAELQTKRALGLCFNCEEKYSPKHVCKNRMINFILAEEETGGVIESEE